MHEQRLESEQGDARQLAALNDPSTSRGTVLKWCRDRRSSEDLLRAIATHHRWGQDLLVKEALLQNVSTPLHEAYRLVRELPWGALAKALRNPRTRPQIKQKAIRILRRKFKELTPGERMSLTREATSDLVALLLDHVEEAREVEGLLSNARLREKDLIRAINSSLETWALAEIADHDKWSSRYRVRFAIVSNPETPERIAHDFMKQLLVQHLREVAKHPRLPDVRRDGATTLLEARTSKSKDGGEKNGRA